MVMNSEREYLHQVIRINVMMGQFNTMCLLTCTENRTLLLWSAC